MIREIRGKFIRIALVVLALAMALVAAVINVANWVDVRSGLNETLNALCQDVAIAGQEFPRDEGDERIGWENGRP